MAGSNRALDSWRAAGLRQAGLEKLWDGARRKKNQARLRQLLLGYRGPAA